MCSPRIPSFVTFYFGSTRMHLIYLLCLLILYCNAQCPSNTTYSGEFGGCLYESVEMQNFAGAARTCQSMGGYLISVHNAFQNTQLVSILTSGMGEQNVLLGLYYGSWTDGTAYNYQKWAPGQPSDGSCAILSIGNNGAWKSIDCNAQYPFICNIPQSKPPTIVPPTSYSHGSCLPGWDYMAKTDSCYYVGYNSTYYDAEKQCESMGSHLASVHSAEENGFVTGLTLTQTHSCNKEKPYYYYTWIGAKFNGGFEWEDGTKFNYTNFRENHPGEGSIVVSAQTGCSNFAYWLTEKASMVMPYFVCKHQLNSK